MHLRSTVYALLVLGGAGCTDGLYDYDSGGDDTGEDADTDTDSDLDTDADTDTDSDSDSDTDTDTDTDTGSSDVCHPADPHGVGGWTRTYTVSYKGQSGQETQSGLGAGQVQSELQAGGENWSVLIQHGCGADGGAVVQGWQGQVAVSVSGTPMSSAVSAQHDIPRKYLPDMAGLKNGADWSYSYNLIVQADGGTGPQTFQIPTTGQYVAFDGKQSVTVGAGTFNAFYVTNEYQQDWSKADTMGLLGFTPLNHFAEQWYVEGLGLVKEIVTDVDTGSVYMQKELTAHTGLSPS